jgi:hypothetical protein
MAWTEVSGNRGLDSTNTTGDQRAVFAINDSSGDKFRDSVAGAQTLTLEVVCAIDAFTGTSSRAVAINDDNGSSPDFGFAGINAASDWTLWWEGTQVRTFSAATGTRFVWHFVYDTTQGTANDRIKIYKDGSVITPTVDANPTQNDTLAFGNGRQFIIPNREDGASWGRATDGQIFYAALYTTAFSAQDCSDNYDVLTLDDDTP